MSELLNPGRPRSRAREGWTRLLVLAGSQLLLGCTTRDRAHARPAIHGPILTLVDSIRLEESDTAYLARPTGLLPSADGSFFVTDAGTARLLRFSRRGLLLRAFGRHGAGPGEFATPTTIGLAGDSLVLVNDQNNLRFVSFDLRTGLPGSSLRREGPVSSMQVFRDTVWLGYRDIEGRTAVGRWVPPQPQVDPMVPYPAGIRESTYMLERFWQLHVLAWPDTLLLGFIAAPDLVLASHRGDLLSTVRIPAIRRRGVAPDIADRLTTLATNPAAQAGTFSVLQAVGRGTRGRVLLVYFDQVLHGNRFTATGWVSVVSADFGSACLDAGLPLSQDSFGRVALRGDTVFTLEQAVTSSDKPVSFVRAYRIDTDDCTWEPTTLQQEGAPAP